MSTDLKAGEVGAGGRPHQQGGTAQHDRAPLQDTARHQDRPPHSGLASNPPPRRAWAYERGRLWVLEVGTHGRAPQHSRASQYGRPPHQGRPPRPPADPQVPAALREVLPDASEQLARAMGLDGPEAVLRRFASGRRCFAAWVEDRIAAYCWVTQAPECIGEMEREFQIPSGEAYIWDCATLPEHRKKGLYTALLSFIPQELSREGSRRIWIGSSLDNLASVRAFTRAGYLPVVTMTYARLFNLGLLFSTGHPAAPQALVDLAIQRMAVPRERAFGPLRVSVSGPVYLPSCAQLEG